MPLPRPLSRPLSSLARLGPGKCLILLESLVALALASAAIRMLSFRRVAAAAGSWGGGTEPPDRHEAAIARIRWAIQAWSSRVPWRTVCFQKGLALHLMLRRRGIASVMHYGVAQNAADGLAAHVWVSAGGRDVIGGEEAHRFVCLATFPAATG